MSSLILNDFLQNSSHAHTLVCHGAVVEVLGSGAIGKLPTVGKLAATSTPTASSTHFWRRLWETESFVVLVQVMLLCKEKQRGGNILLTCS